MKISIKPSVFLVILLPLVASSCQKKNPVVEFQTPKGNFTVELYLDKAPVTAGHFLQLVREHVYDGGSFYRTVRVVNDANPVKITVVQGGIRDRKDAPEVQSIPHETTEKTGIKHLDGVISMARSEPGTAKSEFFICIEDQPELDFGGRRNPDGQGFAAFGRVTGNMELVRSIWQGPAKGQEIDPPVMIYKIVVR